MQDMDFCTSPRIAGSTAMAMSLCMLDSHNCVTINGMLAGMQVRAICEANAKMEGCDECVWEAGKQWPKCDLLAVYSGLCGSNPSEWSIQTKRLFF